jgi:DNA invertase Pin-like site-specific DNA recombinase
MNLNFAYIRVSPKIANESQEQFKTITEYVKSNQNFINKDVNKVFKEENIKNSTDRPVFEELVFFAEAGDSIFIASTDIIVKSVYELYALIERFHDKKINLYFCKEDLSFEVNPSGSPEQIKYKMLAKKLVYIFKNLKWWNTKRDRIEGLKAANPTGKIRGRPSIFTEYDTERMIRLRKSGFSYSEIAVKFNSNRSTIFKYLNDFRLEVDREKEVAKQLAEKELSTFE